MSLGLLAALLPFILWIRHSRGRLPFLAALASAGLGYLSWVEPAASPVREMAWENSLSLEGLLLAWLFTLLSLESCHGPLLALGVVRAFTLNPLLTLVLAILRWGARCLGPALSQHSNFERSLCRRADWRPKTGQLLLWVGLGALAGLPGAAAAALAGDRDWATVFLALGATLALSLGLRRHRGLSAMLGCLLSAGLGLVLAGEVASQFPGLPWMPLALAGWGFALYRYAWKPRLAWMAYLCLLVLDPYLALLSVCELLYCG